MAPSPLLSSLGSYFTPDDQYRHAIVSTSDGQIHEVFFNPHGIIGHTPLGSFCGAQFVSAFYTADNKRQRPVVATASGDIFVVSYEPGQFQVSRSAANFANIIALSSFYAGDDKIRVLIVGTADGLIHEVYTDTAEQAWVTVNQPVLANFPGMTHLAAFYTDDDHNRHVIVATANGAITEIWYGDNNKVFISSPPLATIRNVVSISAYYAVNDNMRVVIVATADGAIQEIAYNSTTPAKVAPLASFPGVIGVSGFYTPDDKNRHVIVVDSRGNVIEVWYAQASTGVFITTPPLASFAAPSAQLEYIGPDITNLDSNAMSYAAYSSPSGRCVGIAGTPGLLHAFSDSGGVWRSVNGGVWGLESGSLAPSQGENASVNVMAVAPTNANRVLAGNAAGLWETTNGGLSWVFLLDPIGIGANGTAVSAVVFDTASRVFVGLNGGVGVQQPAATTFKFVSLNDNITAVVLSETKVWARSQTSLYVSTDNGTSWSNAISIAPNLGLAFKNKDRFVLAATDSFAYLIVQVNGTAPQNPDGCGSNNVLVIYNAGTRQWSTQVVQSTEKKAWQVAQGVSQPELNTCDGSGGDTATDLEILGRRFLKCIHLQDMTLSNVVGQRIQLIFGAGQEVWRAYAQTSGGTITDWNWALGTSGGGFSNRDPVHADIYDFHLDTEAGGRTAWVACDGGIYSTTVAGANYQFSSAATWKPAMQGLHTHQIQSLTHLSVNQVSQPRIAYALGDNSMFFRDTTATPLPFAQWQSDAGLGDGNFSIGDSSAPTFVWLARRLGYERLLTFGQGTQAVTLINAKQGSFIDPSVPTRFRFLPSPRQEWQVTTADVVMMVDLPLVDKNGMAFPTQPGASTNGLPVLIRSRTYEANPDINAGRGVGWTLERSTLPTGCQGFAVSGDRLLSVVYYAFDASTLYAERNGAWKSVAVNLTSSRIFGPVFPNLYDKNVVYVLTSDKGVQVSTDAGTTFQPDTQLNSLLTQGASDVNQIAFNYDSPSSVVVGTESGKLLYSRKAGVWTDLSGLLPSLPIPIRSLAIDCEAIYVGTYGRGLWRITHYG